MHHKLDTGSVRGTASYIHPYMNYQLVTPSGLDKLLTCTLFGFHKSMYRQNTNSNCLQFTTGRGKCVVHSKVWRLAQSGVFFHNSPHYLKSVSNQVILIKACSSFF